MERIFQPFQGPFKPFFDLPLMLGFLAMAGIAFSVVMLIDCLKRKPSEFIHPITKNGEYDKLIWVLGIIFTFQYGFAGAIVYFFVVMRAKREE